MILDNKDRNILTIKYLLINLLHKYAAATASQYSNPPMVDIKTKNQKNLNVLQSSEKKRYAQKINTIAFHPIQK